MRYKRTAQAFALQMQTNTFEELISRKPGDLTVGPVFVIFVLLFTIHQQLVLTTDIYR